MKRTAWPLVIAVLTSAPRTQAEGLDIERFRPALDSQGLIITEGGQSELAGDLNLGLVFHYSYRPLVVKSNTSEILRSLVEHRLAGSFIVSMGILDFLAVGVEVPAVFYQTGEMLNSAGVDSGLSVAGIGDVRVSPKITVLRQARFGISMALSCPVTLPSGDENAFMGGSAISAMPTLALSRTFIADRLLIALNVGAWLHESAKFQDLDTRNELIYRLGAGLRITDWFTAQAETQGGARIDNLGANRPKETPLEWLLALRFGLPGDLYLTVGGGSGLLPGWGTPNARGFLSLWWSPRNHDRDGDGIEDRADRCPDEAGTRENDGCPVVDSDDDGLLDPQDRCPKEAGPKENGGCPWEDSDKDGLTDNIDKCPQEAGPKENGGCPWGDKDQDGVNDNEDRCPEQAGPKENGGCPWGDADKDGLPDNVDKCPQEPEDKDGFEDEDGCPDPDNDRDGVLDKNDKCPDKPETINGFKDDDGCPDEGKGKILVVVKKEKIEILDKIYFDLNRATIQRKSFNLLNQVAQTILAHDEIKHIRVEGHTDSTGSAPANLKLSQRRADAVRDYLTKRSVPAERLESVGYGQERPIASNKTARGRDENRRVEFVIVE